MSRFPTGVTVVAARSGDAAAPFGLTVNSFTSVSLDPPLVLVCIHRRAGSHDRLLEARTFAISVLAVDQGELAKRFAFGPAGDRFEGVVWNEAPAGSPVLDGAVAWLECSIDEVMPGGDHSIVLASVGASASSGGEALAFYHGEYGRVVS